MGMTHEPAQHAAGLRGGVHLRLQVTGIAAFGAESRAACLQITVHVAGGELGVELHAPDRLAPAEGVAGVVLVAGQHLGASRWLQHALQVGGLGGKARGQAGEQRILLGRRRQLDGHGADFASARVGADRAAQRMRQQLVAIADAKQR